MNHGMRLGILCAWHGMAWTGEAWFYADFQTDTKAKTTYHLLCDMLKLYTTVAIL